MADQYVEVTHQSWGQRLRGSMKGIVFGFVMLAGASMLLFWNEGRAVHRAKALNEGEANVISIDASQPASAHQGRLVHFSAEATTQETLRDPAFDVSSRAIQLRREVEMYQWQESSQREERKKLGGGTETVTTYSYSKGWSSSAISSSSFKERQGHENPPFPIEGRSWQAQDVTAGTVRLSPTFISKLDAWQSFAVNSEQLEAATRALKREVRLDNGGFYAGASSLSPEIGDVRVTFSQVPPSTASFVGQLQAGQLMAYQAKTGSVALVNHGIRSSEEMFATARQSNTVLTWILRFAGIFMLYVAFNIIFKPLSVLADVVPAIGNLVEKGVGGVAFALAAALGFFIIAIAWLFYRPLLAITLLALTIGLVVWVVKAMRQRPRKAVIPPPPPGAGSPPPPGTAVPPPPPA